MRLKCLCAGLMMFAFSGLGCAAASAQTDIGLSAYGAFSGRTDGNGYTISPANSAGGIFELRHLANPILGFEGTYSFNRANRNYIIDKACGVSCGNVSAATVKSDAHEVTVDWVPSVKLLGIRPFGVLGVGALFNVPQNSPSAIDTKTDTKVVYVYGAGLDWPVIPHFGLRLQYRGNLYKTPDVTELFTSADKFTHTSEPMIGIYFRL